ncbi:hypothetical protein [Aporhodopirellula aestuarii]|uniref:Transmembrane protein n=1 Tax=Aporhodopirellula aestuarii TaxID=2950107 RepID=A0ABT0U9Y2_9BACT|nr:hypothetical protein [Aporhodopirellula aestuarii]MCM2373151.1 hypothetical protein [Aporhodopirellula aestuarii]
MRIPSQLHGESLYGRTSSRRKAPSAGQSWRRVLRLTIVLALVVVVMRQASRPGVYHVFFPETARQVAVASAGPATATNQPPGQAPGRGQTVIASDEGDSSANRSDRGPEEWTSQKRGQFEEWRDTKSDDELTTLLSQWLRGDDIDVDEDDLVLESERDESFLALAVQQRLIESAKDGTVWRAADGPALLTTLAMHRVDGGRLESLMRYRPVATVAGVLPLLQQPEVYRGRSLIGRGELVRIEKVAAPENPYQLQHYWNLWLMPLDASRRPWLVIVADLPKEFDGLVSDSDQGSPDAEPEAVKQSFSITSPRPIVEVHGEFVKRLSYQSEAGAELTPVIVGHLASFLANGNPIITRAILAADPSRSEQTDQDDDIPMWWIVVGSVVIGLLFSSWVMWRTAVLNRQLRERRARKDVVLSFMIAVGSLIATSPLSAQSLMDLLPGYDPQRLDSIAEEARPDVSNPRLNADEIAKVVFRIDRLSDAVLRERLAKSASSPSVGDAVRVDDVIVESQSIPVSTTLQEYLNLDRIEIIQLSPINGVPRILVSRSLPDEAVPGDHLSGVAVRIRNPASNETLAMIVDVAGRLRWTPKQPESPADEVLSLQGVDLSRLAEVNELDREPLSESDSAVFYPMIGAAGVVSGDAPKNEKLRNAIQRMKATVIDASPVDLLQNPGGFIGDWIRLDVETVRITRVAVETEQRRREIGGDHYYEIDAIGDLGAVQLQIEVPDREPVVMENRYPVTIVMATLPDFLRTDTDGSEQLVSTFNRAIRVEGFFYRLWSYESDFMQQHGGKQFAPLIVAGVITDLRPTSDDPMGVQMIGQIAAVAVIAALLGAIAFHFITRRGDQESRKRRY